jgi:hypothetical protein
VERTFEFLRKLLRKIAEIIQPQQRTFLPTLRVNRNHRNRFLIQSEGEKMHSLQWNLVENETSGKQNGPPRRPVASVTAGETSTEKPRPEKQPAVTEELFDTFTWLFGSGCY